MGEINRQRLCGMLGFAMRAGRLVLGTEQVCLAMARPAKKRPRLVLISHEASANTKKKLTAKGEFYGIQTTTIDLDAGALGQLLGKSYPPMTVAVCDDAFAREIRTALGIKDEISLRKEISSSEEIGDTDG